MSSQPKKQGKFASRVLVTGAFVVAMACTPIIRNHGYIPPAEDLALITVGVDTRETLVATLGTPMSAGLAGDADLYYVASKFRHFGAFEPVETSREVLVISFAESGVVQNVERFGLEDGRVVALSRRVTSTGVRNTTFIRQLLQSIGNFNPAAVFTDG